MECPRCKAPLVTFEQDDIELDFCYACQGIWLDYQEVALAVGSVEQANLFFEQLPDTGNKKSIRCPICRKFMREVDIDIDTDNTVIDICKQAHGAWFDKGELQNVLQLDSFKQHPNLEAVIRSIFLSSQNTSGE